MRRASKGSIDLINILDSNIKPVRDLFFTMTRCDANNSSVTFESFLNKGSGWVSVDEWLYYISGHNGVAKFK